MALETDLEAGAGHLPRLPVPVFRGGVVKQSSLIAELEPHLSSSSSREHVPTTNQPRRRKKIEREPSPAPKKSGQAEEFFDDLQARLEDGVRPNCLFACWEVVPNDHRAVPLLIGDTDNEVQIYRDMAGKLYEKQMWWLRYNPFYQVIAVKEVEFRFLKMHENYFSVIIELLDVSKIEERLASQLQEAAEFSAVISDPECPVDCYEDILTGKWIHQNLECAGHHFSQGCSFENMQMSARKLDRLRLLTLPLLCFYDPAKAAQQRTLEGIAQDSCLYRTSEIKAFYGFKPRLAEAKFRGLMFRFGFQRVGAPFDAPAVGMIIVTLWKVSGGSWEVAFAAGGFFLMLIQFSPRLCRYL